MTVRASTAFKAPWIDTGVTHEELHADLAGFVELATLLKRAAGIHLPTNEKNRSLMAGRLAPVLRELGLSTYREYLARLGTVQGAALMADFIESMTTNTTEFFREGKHFDVLRDQLPRLLRSRLHRQELRVWCSAASTGQEPYTILMSLLEATQLPLLPEIRFLATDIDRTVLQRSADARYSDVEMRGVPPLHRQKYFEPSSREGFHQIRREYRQAIRFAPFNLMTNPYPFQHPFDVVFCRNVLIYFERDAAVAVVERLAKSLRPGGLLFLGHSESGLARTPLLKTISHAVYERAGK